MKKILLPLTYFILAGERVIGPFSYQAIKNELNAANVNYHGHLWPSLKEPDVEKGSILLRHKANDRKELLQEYKNLINTQMIVAALIATVAMTAGFTVPGGFDGNQ